MNLKIRKFLKTIILFIFAILIILLITSITSCKSMVPTSNTTLSANSSTKVSVSSKTNDIDQIKTILESFGKVLVNVSLYSQPDILKKDMEKYYSPFVSKELISKWLQDPTEALGKLTSSPWPDHIEIINIKKLTGDKYEVSGNVLEITSVEETSGGYAYKYGVSLTVERINGKWLIADVVKDLNTYNS